MNKERNTALELLRLAAIFFIILRHYCENVVPFDSVTAETWTWRIAFLQVNTAWGLVANNIFTLISGYFLISRKVNWKRIVLLIAEMFFYSWVFMIILYGGRIVPLSITTLIKQLFPIWFGDAWYVNCYIVLCCFLPFINRFLDGISKKTYQRFLIVSILIAIVAYSFGATTFIGGWQSVDHFIIMFALGGYIKKYGVPELKLSWRTIFFCFAIITALSVIALSCGGALLNKDILITNALYFTEGNNIVCVITSVALFLWIINVKPFYNKTINALSKSVLGIFLIHFNTLLRGVIWDKIFPNTAYLNSDYFLLHCFVKVTAVFVICLLIDQIRILTVEKAFRKFVDKRWDAWRDKAERMRGRLVKLVPFK